MQQIRSKIKEGSLAEGDPLPAIRQLTQDPEINPATVVKAYQILERDGIIQTAGRRGTFVHANATQNQKDTMQKEAYEQFGELISYWHELGMTGRELKEIFNDFLSNTIKKEKK